MESGVEERQGEGDDEQLQGSVIDQPAAAGLSAAANPTGTRLSIRGHCWRCQGGQEAAWALVRVQAWTIR